VKSQIGDYDVTSRLKRSKFNVEEPLKDSFLLLLLFFDPKALYNNYNLTIL